jgi:tetratricopeptide (TPR) repeat protein
VFVALDELLAARVLVADGEGYRFIQRGFVPVLHAGIPEERRRAIHGRIADLLERAGGDVLRRAHHLLCAGRESQAIELLCTINLLAQQPHASLLEHAIEQAERLDFPLPTLHRLRAALVSRASIVLAPESFRRCLPMVLAQLERDSGLARYGERSHLPDAERLKCALADTQERYLETPESERVHTTIEAIRELARLSGALCSFATQVFDPAVLESLPSLEPFFPISPSLAVVQQVVDACKHRLGGRYLRHRQMAMHVLERIAEPDRAGLDEIQHRRTRAGLHFAIGLFEASLGMSGVEARCAALEAEREHRVNAWRVRMILHLNQGNIEEARKCERRAELLQLQDSSAQSYLGMGAGFEVMALAEVGDLVGVKSCIDKLTILANRYPGWRPWLAYGQCRYRWLQGDLTGALEVLLEALEVDSAPHNASYLAGLRVRLLAELGRVEDAVAWGRNYFEIYQADPAIGVGLAQALAAAGEHQEALRTLDPIIAASEQLGSAGHALGVLYEARARIAIRMSDREGFERFAELCGSEYRKARNAALTARFGRLLEDAREHEVGGIESAAEIRELLQQPAPESEYNTVHSRILECVDESDRARCALTLLLQSTDSAVGYLYGVRDGRPVLLAAVPEPPADDDVVHWVEECLHAELECGVGAPVDSLAGETRSEVAVQFSDSEGRHLEPIFLFASQQRPLQIAAVLALHVPPGPRTLPSRHLLEELANELLQHGDVNGLHVGDA